MILRPLFCFEDTHWKCRFIKLFETKEINFFVNRNWKKLTDSRKTAKILADNRKRHHPIETLLSEKAHATKGIVGGFEFSVLQRNWEKNGTRGHGRKVDLTATVSGTVYWSYPILPFGIVPSMSCHLFRKVWKLLVPMKLYPVVLKTLFNSSWNHHVVGACIKSWNVPGSCLI